MKTSKRTKCPREKKTAASTRQSGHSTGQTLSAFSAFFADYDPEALIEFQAIHREHRNKHFIFRSRENPQAPKKCLRTLRTVRELTTKPAAILRWIRNAQASEIDGRNIYHGINPRYPTSHFSTLEDVIQIQELALDIDYKEAWRHHITDATQAIDKLIEAGIDTTRAWIVGTGNGVQFHFRLTHPVPACIGMKLQKAFFLRFSFADEAYCQIRLISRTPGTFNLKNKERKPVVIVQQGTGTYGLDELLPGVPLSWSTKYGSSPLTGAIRVAPHVQDRMENQKLDAFFVSLLATQADRWVELEATRQIVTKAQRYQAAGAATPHPTANGSGGARRQSSVEEKSSQAAGQEGTKTDSSSSSLLVCLPAPEASQEKTKTGSLPPAARQEETKTNSFPSSLLVCLLPSEAVSTPCARGKAPSSGRRQALLKIVSKLWHYRGSLAETELKNIHSEWYRQNGAQCESSQEQSEADFLLMWSWIIQKPRTPFKKTHDDADRHPADAAIERGLVAHPGRHLVPGANAKHLADIIFTCCQRSNFKVRGFFLGISDTARLLSLSRRAAWLVWKVLQQTGLIAQDGKRRPGRATHWAIPVEFQMVCESQEVRDEAIGKPGADAGRVGAVHRGEEPAAVSGEDAAGVVRAAHVAPVAEVSGIRAGGPGDELSGSPAYAPSD